MTSFYNIDDSLLAELRRDLSPAEFANFVHIMDSETVLTSETLKDHTILSFEDFCLINKNQTMENNRREMGRIISTLGFKFNILNVWGDGKCLIHAFMSGCESLREPFEIFCDGILAIFQSDDTIYTQYFTIEDTSATPNNDGEYPLEHVEIHRHDVNNLEKMHEHYVKLTFGNNIDSKFAQVLAYGEKVDVVFISIDNLRSTPSIKPLQVFIHALPSKQYYVDGVGWLTDIQRQVFILSWGGHNYCLFPESPLHARELCDAYVKMGEEERMHQQIAEQIEIERQIAEQVRFNR
jgi:hypothetical protein